MSGLGDYLVSTSYSLLLQSSGSHIAGKVAGTYGMGQGDPLAVSGTGTLYPLNAVEVIAADYTAKSGMTTRYRILANLFTNDVPPTGNFTVALHPITRPATSGGAGLCIYTIGAAVANSGVTFTTPVADGLLMAAGSEFTIPTAGTYIIGVTTTATVATSAHVHVCAKLQMRDS